MFYFQTTSPEAHHLAKPRLQFRCTDHSFISLHRLTLGTPAERQETNSPGSPRYNDSEYRNLRQGQPAFDF